MKNSERHTSSEQLHIPDSVRKFLLIVIALMMLACASSGVSVATPDDPDSPDISYAEAITNVEDVHAISITAIQANAEHLSGSGIGLITEGDYCDYVLTAAHTFGLEVLEIKLTTAPNALEAEDQYTYHGQRLILPTEKIASLIGDMAIVIADRCLPERVLLPVTLAKTDVPGYVQGYGLNENLSDWGQLRQANSLYQIHCPDGVSLNCLTNYNILQKALAGDSGAA